MATISEDYVSFEAAKLLKEKGFDGKCSMYYDIEEIKEMEEDGDSETPKPEEVDRESLMYDYAGIYIKAPSQAIAMKWLRVVHNLFIEITVGENEGKTWYDYDILPVNGKFIYWKKLDVLSPTIECNTPEEAIEVGLKYCLEHLI